MNAIVPAPNGQSTVPPKKQPKTIQLSRRIKTAIDLMVWDCLSDNEAAVRTNSHVQTIRLALKQPNARAYFREQCEMLRSRENPRNTHTLIAIRDQEANQMARVAAIKELERSADQEVISSVARSPGVVIQILTGQQPEHNPAKPLITLDASPVVDGASFLSQERAIPQQGKYK